MISVERKLVAQALAAFGRPDAAARIVKRSTTLTVRVEASDGRYMLRLQPPDRMPLAVVEAEIAWLQAIRRATSLRVPRPIAALDGRSAVPLAGDQTATLFEWLPGRHKCSLTTRDAWRMGEALGQLHQFTSSYERTQELRRWDFDRESFADEHGAAIAEQLPHALSATDLRAVHAAYRFVRDVLAVLDQEPGSYGMIHADTNLTNWLFARGEVALIDFEVCCDGYYLFDIGRLLHLFASDHANSAQLCAALHAGYTTIRPLPPLEDARIRAGVLMSLIDCIVWACALGPDLRPRIGEEVLRASLAQLHTGNWRL